MTTEEKQLLLKDLSARLPYGIIASVRGSDEEFQYFHILGVKDDKVWVENNILQVDHFKDVEVVNPYLRPMSSMTAEEIVEFYDACTGKDSNGDFHIDGSVPLTYVQEKIDWLIAHHFDYRGLIEKGLALPATDGMYNF